eukprot:COSAG04_NODE_1848_length_5409_cov_7.118644_5_plen_100_part_00
MPPSSQRLSSAGPQRCAFPLAGVDGQDLSALFDAPKPSPAPAGAPGKAVAYHQYPACDMDWAEGFNVTRAACNNAPRKTFSYMVRTTICCAGNGEAAAV